jgi:two-component system LytT family sensor kinase
MATQPPTDSAQAASSSRDSGGTDAEGAFPPSRPRVPLRLWFLILAGCLVAGVLDSLQSTLQGVFSDEGQIDWPTVVFQGSEWLFLAALTPLTFYLGQRFPVRRPRVGRALLVHASGALLLCLGWATMGVVLRRRLGRGWTESFLDELIGWTLFSVPWSFFMYFALLGTVHAFAYYAEARNRELQATQLSGQLAEARLRALGAQLQPHFLFNTLNAITVLVRDRRGALAVRMLELLSDMLRQLLRADQPHEIPLRSELRLVQQYLAIEQVRYSDRLRVLFAVEEDALAGLVPSFVFQPLVENALRHGLAGRGDDAIIEIGARRTDGVLELWVRDNGRGLTAGTIFGVGLENTRERLAALYGERAGLTLSESPGGGVVARIRVPWRPDAADQPEVSAQ